MNMVVGYQQVRVQKEDIPKTAFVIVWRQYEYPLDYAIPQ